MDINEKQKQKIREKCISELAKIGAVKSFDSIAHVYHGNIVENADDFYFDQYYERAEGYFRVHGSAGFYATEDYEFADAFATKRMEEIVEEYGGDRSIIKNNIHVHEIVAANPNKNVFVNAIVNKRVNERLQKKEHEICSKYASTYDFNEIIPLAGREFSTKNEILKLIKLLNDRDGMFKSSSDFTGKIPIYSFLQQDIEKRNHTLELLAQQSNVSDKNLILKYCGYAYVYRLFKEGKWESLVSNIVVPSAMVERQDSMVNVMCDSRAEFAKAVMQKCNIVGVCHIDTQYIFWDNDSINTRQFVEKQKNRNRIKYEQITKLIGGCFGNKKDFNNLKISSPEQTVDYVKMKSPFIRTIFNNKVAEQYTETCLRVFDDSYKNEIPTELVPFVKVLLVANGVRNFTLQNKNFSNKIVYQMENMFNFSKEMTVFADFLINNAKNFANDFYVKNDITAVEKMNQQTLSLFLKNYERKPTEEELIGVKALATILQTCSMGAKSTMGVSRDLKTGIYYFNDDTNITNKMQKPKDPAKRKQRLKTESEIEFEGLKEHFRAKKQNDNVKI